MFLTLHRHKQVEKTRIEVDRLNFVLKMHQKPMQRIYIKNKISERKVKRQR
jgi:hypothetical protein